MKTTVLDSGASLYMCMPHSGSRITVNARHEATPSEYFMTVAAPTEYHIKPTLIVSLHYLVK